MNVCACVRAHVHHSKLAYAGPSGRATLLATSMGPVALHLVCVGV